MTLATAPIPLLRITQVVERVLLSMSAGAVNAGAYLACQRFVSHVTGTLTLIGVDIGSLSLALEYLLVLLCFVMGAASAVFLLARLPANRYPVGPLRLVALLILIVAALGSAGLFGAFGKSVEGPEDFVLLSLLSFAMGLLNSIVASSAAIGVRVTHVTGHATELGIQLARSCVLIGYERGVALRSAGLLIGKMVGFAAGAASMVLLVRRAEYLSFTVAAALTLVAAELGRLAYERRARQPLTQCATV